MKKDIDSKQFRMIRAGLSSRQRKRRREKARKKAKRHKPMQQEELKGQEDLNVQKNLNFLEDLKKREVELEKMRFDKVLKTIKDMISNQRQESTHGKITAIVKVEKDIVVKTEPRD
ncbi:hypothetical protein N0V93_002234 [Gnomoniopsis smithogilvyi]|uniref:Uncharacterized protein n=1 Tax=Gnomoniopsis smithogilvyi TaxID=1191159 RepID=A0A9W9CYW0_9PEZI|nr:hypothetical protein N0V93_002234 [Gnomoniopsis smithogilvyi]